MSERSNLEQVKNLAQYRILREKHVEEMNSEGVILEHIKSGAKLFLMANDDDNKVFCIGFRTPPKDSTGLPHILEHSVLEGSEKFPLKDPFVELVKGSLNTFLNAMTYPDKTVYPVASCNDKDFRNLQDVYMDGVLHPRIYTEPKIFQQEGWHYEMESLDAPLTINGVVYNEMKGAFSSADSVLDRYTRACLFPDTCYANESGGDPAVIPDLSYEQFIEFHKTYYHPANSYIYIYGDMDMAEQLTWLDEAYLSGYDRADCPVNSAIAMQKPFEKPIERRITYSVTEEEGTENMTYLSVNTVVGTDLDPQLYVAFQILEYALISAPGAPLKKALIEAGIGADVLGGYESGILQPYFSVIAKNANPQQKAEFLMAVRGTLRKLANQGVDKKSILAGLNYYEFRYREADYGSAPQGLMYGLWCLDSWLYDGDPLMHLEYQKTFDFLKHAVNEGYFEQLIRDYLLDNPHEAVIVLEPEIGKTHRDEEALAEKLAAYKTSLSEQEQQALVQNTKDLKEYQETPDTPEDVAKIPMLEREDIARVGHKLGYEVKKASGATVVHTNLFTSGIAYMKLLFDTNRVPSEDLPYLGLLKAILGYVDTDDHSYADLTSEIYLNSGGVDFAVTSYIDVKEPKRFTGAFVVSAKALYDKLDFVFETVEEILTRSRLSDEKRLGEILEETRSRVKSRIEDASHGVAVARATSYFSPTSGFNDRTGGIAYYHFLEEVTRRFAQEEAYRAELIEKLTATAAKLFVRDNVLVSITADDEGYHLFTEAFARFEEGLPEGTHETYAFEWKEEKKNEGFVTSSQVNYVARCGSFANSGYSYTGALKVLKVILNYDYLWMNLRVKGGAYGCMSGFGRSGEGYLVSYRDPNLSATNATYEGIPAYLHAFETTERDMTKYVIGTMSDVDAPLMPAAKGSRNLSAYLSGVTDEEIQREREEVLDVTAQDIRNLEGIVQAILDTNALCAVGNGRQIKEEAELFGATESLFH